MDKSDQHPRTMTSNPGQADRDPAQGPTGGNDLHLPPEQDVPVNEHTDAPAPIASYEIGYGKPPVKHRFKPGRSGNPKGRPKGVQSVKSLVRTNLDAKVTVTTDRGRRRMTKREVAVQRFVTKAMNGDEKAMKIIMEIDGETSQAAASRATAQFLTEDEHKNLRDHLDYLRTKNVKRRD